MKKITPVLQNFLERFPYFADKGLTQGLLDNALLRGTTYISNVVGEINLSRELQESGVYLSVAHILFLTLNPDKTGGRLTNATEGSVSAGFQSANFSSIRDWALGRSEYGLELIQILQQVQPPLPEKYTDLTYYNGF